MAEAPEAEPMPTANESVAGPANPFLAPSPPPRPADEDEPLTKRPKMSQSSDRLEFRLGGILCCAVCLDLPPAAVYQVSRDLEASCTSITYIALFMDLFHCSLKLCANNSNLVDRLGTCNVLSYDKVYKKLVKQCCNGHLMCAPCFTHLLADARLRDESHATCPNCRVEISKITASRNLAVEKTVSELPSECKYCMQVFPRHSLQHHEENTCEESEYKFAQIVVSPSIGPRRYLDGLVRIVCGIYALLVRSLRRTYLLSDPLSKPRRYRRLMGCRYACIGCPWRGPAHEVFGHEAYCLHPGKSAADVVSALEDRERAAADAAALYSQMLDLLSYEKITFNDLQLKPYRTEEFMTKLYYESSRFSAFGQQWVVKAFVNKNQRDPTQSAQREITYQLILKSKPLGPVPLQWVLLRGPHGEAHLQAAPRAHVYREDASDAPPLPLPLLDPADANRLLSNKAIHFRLIMFQASK